MTENRQKVGKIYLCYLKCELFATFLDKLRPGCYNATGKCDTNTMRGF